MLQKFRRQRPAAPETGAVAEVPSQIVFRAYADDYTVSGEIEVPEGRLHELLEHVDDLAVQKVRLRALDDGRQHDLPSAVIRREELCAVVATGPRGDPHRRYRTRSYPMRAVVGPYTVIGYVHATPNVDPMTWIHRRQIVALSPARIAFDLAGERIEELQDALLLIRSKIDVLQSATDEAVRLATGVDGSPTHDGPEADEGPIG